MATASASLNVHLSILYCQNDDNLAGTPAVNDVQTFRSDRVAESQFF